MLLEPTAGLRRHKRLHVQDSIVNAAVDLFLDRGFPGTLVDDIAAAASVSRRTFFNYFPSKHAVLSHWFHSQGDFLAARLTGRPTTEPLWASLQAAYLAMRTAFGRDGERIAKLRRLLAMQPALMVTKYECLAATQLQLTPIVEQRLPRSSRRHLVAQVYVQAAAAAYNAACADWESTPAGRTFEKVLSTAFQLSAPAVSSGTPRRHPR